MPLPTDPRLQGELAARNGCRGACNPFEPFTLESTQWIIGFYGTATDLLIERRFGNDKENHIHSQQGKEARGEAH